MALPEYQRQISAGQAAGPLAIPRGDPLVEQIGVIGRQVEKSLADVAMQDAESKGALDGVQRDANGRLVFQPRTEWTKEAKAYNNAALAAYTSEFANDHQRLALQRSQEFRDNPGGFNAFWKAHMEGALQQVPPAARGRAAVLLGDIGTRFESGITTAKANRDYALAGKSWDERLGMLQDDLDGLAGSGGIDSPAYKEKAGEFEAVLQDGINARFLTPEMADLRRKAVANRTTGLVLGNVAEQAYRNGVAPSGFGEHGDYGFNIGNMRVSAAPWVAKGKPFNGFETFPTPETGVGNNYKNVLATEKKLGGSMTFQQLAESWAPAADKNDPEAWAKAVAKSAGLEPGAKVPTGDDAAMAKVMRGINVIEKGRITVPEDAFAAGIAWARAGSPTQSAAAPSPARRMGAVFAVVNRIYDDPTLNLTTAQRQHYASQVITRANQLDAERRVAAADLADQAQAYTLNLVAGKQAPDGRLGAIADRFAELGDQSEAARYRLLAEREAELAGLRNMSVADMDRYAVTLLTGPAGEIARTMRAEKGAAATALRVEARQDFQDVKTMADAGATPQAMFDKARTAAAKARQSGDVDLANDIAGYFEAYRGASQAVKLPKDQLAKFIGDLRANAEDAKDGMANWQMLQMVEKMTKEKRALLESDPMQVVAGTYRDELGPVASLDWSRPDGIAGALRARSGSAAKLEQHEGVPVLPLFADEIDRLKTNLDAMPVEMQGGLLGALRDGLSPVNFGRLMQKVGQGTPAQQAFAAAGILHGSDPALARDVLAGAAALKAQPGLLPSGKGSDWNTALGDEIGNAFREAPEAGATAEAAIRALYAKGASDAGDRSGKIDKDRLSAATRQVIGGNVELFRGESLLPVGRRSSASPSEALAALRDDDLPGGQPIRIGGDLLDAARIARFGVLSNAGDGRYFLRVPMGGRLQDVIDPNTGARLVLDLRDAATRAHLNRDGATTGDLGISP